MEIWYLNKQKCDIPYEKYYWNYDKDFLLLVEGSNNESMQYGTNS